MVKETMTPKQRMWAAVKLEPYDRVPVAPLLDVMFPARHRGMTLAQAFSDYKGKGWQAMVDLFDEVGGWDGFLLPGYSQSPNPRRPMGARTGRMKYPGQGLPDDSIPQYIEDESMTIQDYDDIIRLGWFGWGEKLRARSGVPIEKSVAWAERQIAQWKREMATWEAKGVPSLIGAIVSSPLMTLSTSRSMTAFAMDIHRIPDKVQAVMDAMVGDLITNTLEVMRLTGGPGVMLVLERGGGFYFPPRVFERFEFPYMKKMVNAFVKEGITPILHFDSDWTLNMPYLKELPHRKFFIQLDSKTDIFKAKDILRDTCCIMGDVAPSLLSLGTPNEVSAYCRKLIDVVGKGGGLILGVGCGVPVDAKFENLKMMIDTAREYNPHRA